MTDLQLRFWPRSPQRRVVLAAVMEQRAGRSEARRMVAIFAAGNGAVLAATTAALA